MKHLFALVPLVLMASCAEAPSAPGPFGSLPPIVFVSMEDGIEDIYTMDVRTGERRRVTVTDSVAGEQRGSWVPAWSPDYRRIVFASNRDDGGAANLYVVDRDGSNLERLTDHDGFDYTPDYAPDGSRIAFLSDRDGAYDLYTMASDGSDVRRLTELAEAPGRLCCPDWHPDGTTIAFMVRLGGFAATIWTVDVDGGDPVQLLAGAGLPRWSPDGKGLAYVAQGFQVVVADSGFARERRITDMEGSAMYPVWSPDGSRIVFSFLPDEPGEASFHDAELYLVGMDGSDPVRLTDNDFLDAHANWW